MVQGRQLPGQNFLFLTTVGACLCFPQTMQAGFEDGLVDGKKGRIDLIGGHLLQISLQTGRLLRGKMRGFLQVLELRIGMLQGCCGVCIGPGEGRQEKQGAGEQATANHGFVS